MPTCLKCGQEFTTTRTGGRPQKYCKNPCGGSSRVTAHPKERKTASERFWKYVDTSAGPEGCWLWTGTLNHRGYGNFYTGGGGGVRNQTTPNKFALEEKLGRRLVAGEQALRTCRNHACVNPAHLYPGRESLLEDGPTRECKKCGKSFQVTRVAGKSQLYCSAKCRNNPYYVPVTRRTEEERFWSHVEVRGPDECWLWKDATVGNGYGAFVRETKDRVRGHQTTASGYSLSLHLGRPLLPGKLAAHTCDNPPCVNPKHLFEATQAENIEDARVKGRLVRNRQPQH